MNLRNIFTRANVLSAKRHNAVANVVNSLANLKVVRGSKDALYISDTNAILELKKSLGGTSTGSGVLYRGAWSNGEDYVENDLVFHTTTDENVRMLFIAEGASGPNNGGAVTPTYPPDQSPMIWRCLSKPLGLVWRGEYSIAEVYSPNDLVFTGSTSDPSQRSFWICEIKNGPDTVLGVTAPTNGTVWFCMFTPDSFPTFRYKSQTSDYLVCRAYSGGTESETDTHIAKPPKLRFSVTSATVDSTTISYSSYSTTNQTRVATAGAVSEIQIITPRYLVNDIIFAASSSYTGVEDVTLIDMNMDGRAWARRRTQ